MEKLAERLDWIRDLVRNEEKMDETGIVDMSVGFDNAQALQNETLRTLLWLKNEFVDACNAFNDLKTTPLGRIKVYGVAKTQADFMLFRNGYKMIFSLREP